MNATTKMIQIEDWYAPAFIVQINAPQCAARLSARRSVSGSRMFRVAHRGPCDRSAARRMQRATRLALLNHE